MNSPDQRSFRPEPKRSSHRVALVLLGAVGVVGGVVAWDAWRRAGEVSEAGLLPEAPATPVAADREYKNNEYIPGVGYYHAPYHAWYPYPYNHHDASRGYFGGGLWYAAPLVLSMLNSRPNNDAVVSAMAAQQRAQQEQRAHAGTSGFSSGRSSGSNSSSFTSRPTSSPSTSKPSIQRGGFGSSGHSSGSGSGS
jgi:hypothetical protein